MSRRMLIDDRAKYLDPPVGQLVEVATPFEEGLLVTIEEAEGNKEVEV